jgi:twitching motility two-component system response regulator PilG
MKDDTHFSGYAIVIDPSLIVRTIIRICLGREGIEVVAYEHPLEALHAMARPKGMRVPDLVFVEVDFPQSPLNGYTMVQLLRSKEVLQRTPILMISNRDRIYDRLLARLAGANEYLVKPLETQDLIQVIQRYMT